MPAPATVPAYPLPDPDNSNFPTIRQDGTLYVDKTPWLRALLKTTPSGRDASGARLVRPTQLVARPRRFGKTMLVDTLEAWFQGLPPGHDLNTGRPEDRGSLSGMPDGWASPAWLWDGLDAADWHGVHGWRPVLRLNLALRAGSADEMESRLRKRMAHLVKLWDGRGVDWDVHGQPDADNDPVDTLETLIASAAATWRRRPPMVLIDEYDALVTGCMASGRDPRPAVDLLGAFYRVFKDNPNLYGVFATGITQFAHRHLFSAGNNMRDRTRMPDLSGLCGFTEAEVEADLKPHRRALQAMDKRFDDDQILDDWRHQYNGYRFSDHPDGAAVYNPYTLVCGLDDVLHYPNSRERGLRGLWPSAWSDTGLPRLALLLADPQRTPEGGPPGLSSLEIPDLATLMLETGCHTHRFTKGSDKPVCHFPNREVARGWAKGMLVQRSEAVKKYEPGFGPVLHELKRALLNGNIRHFANTLDSFTFGLAYDNLHGETCCRTLLQSLFMLMDVPHRSERHTRGGRADHEVEIGDHIYVIEVKFDKEPVKGLADKALAQIRDHGYGRDHLARRDRNVTALALAWHRDPQGFAVLSYRSRPLAALLAARDGAEAEPAPVSETDGDTEPAQDGDGDAGGPGRPGACM